MKRFTIIVLLSWPTICFSELNKHFRFVTPVDTFRVPVTFAPIPKWQEMIVPDIEADNFVFAITPEELTKISLESDADVVVTFISQPEPHMKLGARCKSRPKSLDLPDLCMKRIQYKKSQVKYFYPADFSKVDLEKMDKFIRYLLDEWRHN